VRGSGISWAIRKSAPRSRQITTTAPHYSVYYRPDALPATQPTASKHWRQQVASNATVKNAQKGLVVFKDFQGPRPDSRTVQDLQQPCHDVVQHRNLRWRWRFGELTSWQYRAAPWLPYRQCTDHIAATEIHRPPAAYWTAEESRWSAAQVLSINNQTHTRAPQRNYS